MTSLDNNWQLASDGQWNLVKSTVEVGDEVGYVVCSHEPFGMLIEVLTSMADGVIEAIVVGKAGFRNPDDYPPVGSTQRGMVLELREREREIELYMIRHGKC